MADATLKLTDEATDISDPNIEEYEPTESETVSGTLTSLLDSGSKYMTSARASGLETANERGLLNSSMAAQASEKAAIDAALPIAEQDAGYMQDRGLAKQSGAIEGELSKQEAGQTSELSKQEAGQTSQLSKQEAGQELEAAERGYEFETELEETKQAGATERAEIEANTALATLASEEMTSLTAALTDLATQYAKSVQDAYDQTSWTTSYRDNYLKQLKEQYESDKEELYNIYSS